MANKTKAPRVIAKAYLVDKDKSYAPGDEIVSGTYFDEAVYYASLGHVTIELPSSDALEIVKKTKGSK